MRGKAIIVIIEMYIFHFEFLGILKKLNISQMIEMAHKIGLYLQKAFLLPGTRQDFTNYIEMEKLGP